MTLRWFPSLAILLVVTAAIAGCRIFGSYPCGADSDCPADLALCREARCTAPPIADSPSAEGEGEPEGPAEGEGEGENQGEGEGEDPAEGEGENQGEGEGEDPAEGEGEGENPGEGEGEGEGEGGLRPCERIVDIVPADGFAIDAGITVHFEMPLFDVIAGGRHNLQLWDGMVSLPRFIDPAVVDRLYVTTRLPAVPGDGLQLLASACNNAEPENDERSVVDYVFRAGDMAVDEAVCPVPTTTAEECGISRPDLAFIYLNAVGSCRVVPANGFSIVWTQPLELTDGRYLVEYDWSMAGVLYDFCEGNTSGSAFVEVGDTRFGTHSVSIPGFGRGCVGSEARPTNSTAARIVGTFGLFAGSPLRIGLTAGDCANVELGIRNLRIERTVVPLPTITVRP